MSRARKPPRLWLRKEPGRPALWIILDHGRQIATGAGEADEEKAREALAVYMRDVYVPPGRFDHIGAFAKERHVGFVYFITSNDVPNFPIKIGYARNAADVRLKALQVGSPYLLSILATVKGSRGTESRLHREFGHLRMRGEWFQRGPDLMEFVAMARLSVAGAMKQPGILRMFSDRSHEKGDVNA